MSEDQQQNIINKRITKQKEILLEQFRKLSVVQVACKKTGISRATYYRWRKEEPKFGDKADDALEEGRLLINDLAVSKLVVKIGEGDFGAIKYWLSNNHKNFKPRFTDSNNKVIEFDDIPDEVVKQIDRLFEINRIDNIGEKDQYKENSTNPTKRG